MLICIILVHFMANRLEKRHPRALFCLKGLLYWIIHTFNILLCLIFHIDFASAPRSRVLHAGR